MLLQVFEKYRDKVEFAYLFGSVARDNVQPLSDIDIAVYLSDKIKESMFDISLSLYADFCRVLKRNDIDVLVLNTSTNIILLEDIVRHGVEQLAFLS